jgi:hypothetical protein
MKKIILLAAAIMMATVNVNAQDGYEDTKHEVAISAGGMSNSQWIDVLEEITTVIVGATYKNEHFFGPISAEYFYHAKNWLGVGAILTYGQSSQDMYLAGTKDGKATNTYTTLMPAAKFNWLRKKYFGMYSKVAVGATLRHESIDSDDPQEEDYSNSDVHFNWQVSALGIEAGSPRIRGFVELGVGEQGMGLIGLRYKF